jgi:hypothetical protein
MWFKSNKSYLNSQELNFGFLNFYKSYYDAVVHVLYTSLVVRLKWFGRTVCHCHRSKLLKHSCQNYKLGAYWLLMLTCQNVEAHYVWAFRHKFEYIFVRNPWRRWEGEIISGCEMQWSCSGKCSMVRFYEHGDETSCSIKARNILAFWIRISLSKKILHLEYLSSFFCQWIFQLIQGPSLLFSSVIIFRRR